MRHATDTVTVKERRRLRQATLTTLEQLHSTYQRLQDQAERAGQQDTVIALAEQIFLLEDRLARLQCDTERE